jgi:uncharacterized protein (DUF849 family)
VEIAEEAKRAYDAGAAAVHIHARNDDGSPTFSPATFAKIKEEIQKRCPIILNFSTGTISDDVSEQAQYIRECRPEIAALNMGDELFEVLGRGRHSSDMVFKNPTRDHQLLSAANEAA